MACWLYQINALTQYSQERYRSEVWEGNVVTNWTIGDALSKPKEMMPGDTIILFYVKASKIDPGIYGWGVIIAFDKESEDLNFRPASPSDYLKMNPVPERSVIAIIDVIRGKMTQKTIFKVEPKELEQLRQKIAEHVYGIAP
jgi:hypothetical protein